MSHLDRAGVGSRTPLFLGILLFAISVGCESAVGPTAGRVRFEDGSPVQSGRIEFRAIEDGSRYTGQIDADGHFEPVDPNDRPGLPPGEYEVVVVQMVLTEDLAADAHEHGRTVPRQYADYYTSDLRTKIREGERGAIEITLATTAAHGQ